MRPQRQPALSAPAVRPAHLLVAAAVFGVAVAALKGSDAGVRDSIGNISAPWLLLPYLAGTTVRSPIRGAVLGAAACLTALAGFYVAEAFVLDLGDHPLLTDLRLTIGAGRYYFIFGVLLGPLFGALGGATYRNRLTVTALVLAFLLVGEPLAVFAWIRSAGVAPADTGFVAAYPALWMGEMVLGVLVCVVLLAWSRRHGAPG
jgi:hypothetical protein